MPTPVTELPAWQALQSLYDGSKKSQLKTLFQNEPDRFERFSRGAAGLLLDFSKQRISDDILAALLELAQQSRLPEATAAMFSGSAVNGTENRPALHTALRANSELIVGDQDINAGVQAALQQMERLVSDVQTGQWAGYTGERITDVVNIGIGGSDLGPMMVCEALTPYHQQITPHFVSNMDGCHIQQTLNKLNPATTLFVVTSKSFTTAETSQNLLSAQRWFAKSTQNAAVGQHFIAVTANPAAAEQAGFLASGILAFSDWVGGRYSLWSTVGITIALTIGFEHFRELLNGAAAMDQHFRTAEPADNLPLLAGLLAIWNNNFYNSDSHCVVPYSQNLHWLPAWLQQLDMESLGKRSTTCGKLPAVKTGQIVWGSQGTNGQHAYFQLLHQGQRNVSIDFILPLTSAGTGTAAGQGQEHQQQLVANCLAQSRALMLGRSSVEVAAQLEDEESALIPHCQFDGNRSSSTILVDSLTPFNLGSLLAFYEHRVFVQAQLWGINAFDQWGVELGKQLADEIRQVMQCGGADSGSSVSLDASTAGLLEQFQAASQPAG